MEKKQSDKDFEKLKNVVENNDNKEKEIEKTIQDLKDEKEGPSVEELYAESIVKIDELNATIAQLTKDKELAETKLKNQKDANVRLINRLETRETVVNEVKHSSKDNFDKDGNFIIFRD